MSVHMKRASGVEMGGVGKQLESEKVSCFGALVTKADNTVSACCPATEFWIGFGGTVGGDHHWAGRQFAFWCFMMMDEPHGFGSTLTPLNLERGGRFCGSSLFTSLWLQSH